MSKINAANETLTAATKRDEGAVEPSPSSQDGSGDGQRHALLAAPDAILAEPRDPAAGPERRWCPMCSALVVPARRGVCPVHNIFLARNYAARKHPVNVTRRDVLYAEAVDEFQPTTMSDRAICRHLASALEALENLRPGSNEWSRLTTSAKTSVETLRARLPVNKPAADGITRVVRVIVGGDGREHDADEYFNQDDPAESAPAPTLPATTATPTAARCAYCGHTPCIGTEHEHYRALHSQHPDEIARRDAEANELFLHQIGNRK